MSGLFQQINKRTLKFPKSYAKVKFGIKLTQYGHNNFLLKKTKKSKRVFQIIRGSHKRINKVTSECLILIKDIFLVHLQDKVVIKIYP